MELARHGAEVAYVHTATLAREIGALQDAIADFPRADLLLITLDQPAVFDISEGITVITVHDWLLSEGGEGKT